MTRLEIAYLPGDGVGPEVGAAALRVLEAAGRRFGFALDVRECLIGLAAINETGEPLPGETLTAAKNSGAALLGAVGGAAHGSGPRPESGLLALRRELGVFANLRPIRPHAAAAARSPIKSDRLEGVDLLFVRELTGGLYFGEKTRDETSASDLCAYRADEIERVTRLAVRFAKERTGRIAHVDKANVLETSRLWRETVTRLVAEIGDGLALEHVLVDAMAMHLLTRPRDFDVILTENLFGDILTDEGSVLAGSIGLLPSASLGDGGPGLYEPIHGSAPDIAGQEMANPIGMVLSAALMLRWSFEMPEAAAAVEGAVDQVLADRVWTADLGGSARTRDVAEAIAAALG